MLALRSLAFNICFYALTTVLAVAGLPTLVSGRAVMRLAYLWGRITLWLLQTVAGTRVEFRGLDNIPPGPMLVAAKHQSALETLALCTVLPNFAYILKRELLFIPLIGWYLSRSGMVAIDRSKGARAMSLMNAAAVEAIRQGRRLIIFPEGTRRSVGAPPAYKQGLSHLYTALHVPCLPVALNTGLFWSRNSLVRRSGTAIIEFLPIIPPGLPRQEFQVLVQDRLEAASSALADGARHGLDAAAHPVPDAESTPFRSRR
ncbi:1-acyl-sn-glycerol-3-phosphate acyltransferase [Methylobacterium sp. J-088]|uniref:lysophospholipid acyltransferase family protein n=1 Tax=Methylobacterium sp. J-088 TaxID=2836664 RepID=UPI001FB933A3|nr:lysophospholipid acyltransferase family protein [Methylobacterium sp. J-088]MCJ2065269.1 1-acyl-sn-glycerol-3-phosphate acyltransferase [Methylobacterium sp. J-088]